MKRTFYCLQVFLLTWLAFGTGAGMAAETDPPALSLANTYHDDVDLGEYWVSEKLDGVRAFWDGEALVSRRGNRFIAPSWFVEGFPSEPLDGELWMGRGTFDALSGIVRRHVPEDGAWRKIRYLVFDLPMHPGTFDERLVRMKELLGGLDPSRIALVEQFRVGEDDELTAILDRVVKEGGEGLMLRRGESRYLAGRSDDLLKLKTFEDAEAVVVATPPGQGEVRGHDGIATRRNARWPPLPAGYRLLRRNAPLAAAGRGDGHLQVPRQDGQRSAAFRELPCGFGRRCDGLVEREVASPACGNATVKWTKFLPSATPRLDDHVSIWSIKARDARPTFFRIVGVLWLVALVFIVYKTPHERPVSGAVWLGYGEFGLEVLAEFASVGIAIAIISMVLTRVVNTTGELLMTPATKPW